jgi:hypothetical protein
VESGRHSLNVYDWLKKAISSGLAFRIGVKSLVDSPFLRAINEKEAIRCIQWYSTGATILRVNKNVNSMQLNKLALILVGYTMSSASNRDYLELQQRLLPHANYVRYLGWLGDNNEL